MRPFCLGLTGSIAMGKTTTAAIFRNLGIDVWDADATVHQLYLSGGQASKEIAKVWPDAIKPDGSVCREALRKITIDRPDGLSQLNNIVHPLISDARIRAIATAGSTGKSIILLDIPLLFEVGADKECDAIIVVSALPETQRTRIFARPDMSEALFQRILSNQMPDDEKRARADYIIETTSLAHVEQAAKSILLDIQQKRRLS